MSFRDMLLMLNIILPFILGWIIMIERRVSKIEGYCKGRTECKNQVNKERG
jgi:hypothetical protein